MLRSLLVVSLFAVAGSAWACEAPCPVLPDATPEKPVQIACESPCAAVPKKPETDAKPVSIACDAPCPAVPGKPDVGVKQEPLEIACESGCPAKVACDSGPDCKAKPGVNVACDGDKCSLDSNAQVAKRDKAKLKVNKNKVKKIDTIG